MCPDHFRSHRFRARLREDGSDTRPNRARDPSRPESLQLPQEYYDADDSGDLLGSHGRFPVGSGNEN